MYILKSVPLARLQIVAADPAAVLLDVQNSSSETPRPLQPAGLGLILGDWVFLFDSLLN